MAICEEPSCGVTFKRAKHWQRFCCTACRKRFEIRATRRGALCYQHLMAWRYDRKKSGGVSIVTLSQLTADFHREDLEMRAKADAARALPAQAFVVHKPELVPGWTIREMIERGELPALVLDDGCAP